MKKWSLNVLISIGILTAMDVILTRLVSIQLGPVLRLSLGTVPVVFAGVWFGPAAGAAVGAMGDLIGCLISGYPPNPLILLAMALNGLIPGCFSAFLKKKRGAAGTFLRYLAVLGAAHVVTSQGIMVYALSTMYGQPMRAVFWTRLPQTAAVTVMEAVLVPLLVARIPRSVYLKERKKSS